MINSKTIYSAICLLFCFTQAQANYLSQADRHTFIEQYAMYAIHEMHRSDIPASIKMAQFILETDWGRSPLWRKGKNGFGIKCKNSWTGATIFKKDDDYNASGELEASCFRAYPDVQATFKDHSDFLRYRKYYADLFNLDMHDYRGWAYGLYNCKYATDKAYAKKLIELIEKYGLD